VRGRAHRPEWACADDDPPRCTDFAAGGDSRHPARAAAGLGSAAAEPATPAGPARGSDDVIEFDNVTITYPDADEPTLRNVHLVVAAGELCLVVGRTGSGKSTLLRAVNGLVPHFTGGRLSGR